MDFSRSKFRRRADRRTMVPRANILANVAAENIAADWRAKFFGNRAAQLDREIRDAQPRIEHVRLDKRARGARVQTQPAISAQIGRRGFGQP